MLSDHRFSKAAWPREFQICYFIMCGIVGYVGRAESAAVPVLVDGLHRLEYRGYDSAGLAVGDDSGALQVRKAAGRLDNLRKALVDSPAPGNCGISHTRWATHGPATDDNAHPHLDQSGQLALVHNGVIENYQALREKLESDGHRFHSQTDSEVLAHLVGKHYGEITDADGTPEMRLVEAVRRALGEVSGTYGIVAMHTDAPDFLVGARLGSPLVVGLGKGENFLASDVGAVIAHTADAIYLKDRDLVYLTATDFKIEALEGGSADFEVSRVEYTQEDSEKGDYPHFMLKEIFEQPESIRNAFRGRLSDDEASAKLGGLNLTPQQLRDVDRIVLVGCGTASHAAMVGEYLIESLARIPTEVETASEFRYRNPPLDKNTLIFVLSQSGETIDTLAALREGQRKGHRVLGIVNTVGSTMAITSSLSAKAFAVVATSASSSPSSATRYAITSACPSVAVSWSPESRRAARPISPASARPTSSPR